MNKSASQNIFCSPRLIQQNGKISIEICERFVWRHLVQHFGQDELSRRSTRRRRKNSNVNTAVKTVPSITKFEITLKSKLADFLRFNAKCLCFKTLGFLLGTTLIDTLPFDEFSPLFCLTSTELTKLTRFSPTLCNKEVAIGRFGTLLAENWLENWLGRDRKPPVLIFVYYSLKTTFNRTKIHV